MRTWILVVCAVLALLVVPLSPVQLSYTGTDSMQPTINPGDGFVVVSTGDYEPGDVVLFYSEERGEHVVHRIVEQTREGYITRGDANSATDQATGLPPIEREAVVGELLVVAGVPVVVPMLGTAIEAMQANPLFALVVATLAGLAVLRGGRRSRRRSVFHVGETMRTVFLTGLVGALVPALLLGVTTHTFTYTAVDGSPQSADEIAVDEPADRTFEVAFSRSPFTRTFVEADGMTVQNQTRNGSIVTMDAQIPPPESGGTVETTVRTHAYPATLPVGVQRALHEVHPLVALAVSAAAVFVPLYVLYLLLLDGGAPLRSPRSRWVRRTLGGEN